MTRKGMYFTFALTVAFLSMAASAFAVDLAKLGENLFFDTNLSRPKGQSCASCHDPNVGFTSPNSDVNAAGAVVPGARHGRAGNRKPPTAAYAGQSPNLYYDADEGVFVGGVFWDGRASGETLGDPLAEQAIGPFLNPLEQNIKNERRVVLKVLLQSDYGDMLAEAFEEMYGAPIRPLRNNIDDAYILIGRAIAAFERSDKVNPYSSKYDYWVRGEAQLTDQEKWGLELFEGKAQCSLCHITTNPNNPESREGALFTDFTYDNLGVPKNPENPFYDAKEEFNPLGENWIDQGLGGFLISHPAYGNLAHDNMGKQKVPTLRNVGKIPEGPFSDRFVKAYTHNGFFKSLKDVVHFYNTRDVEAWPAPEVAGTVNFDELGNLGLTDEEEDAVVAFMETLTDGYQLECGLSSQAGVKKPKRRRNR